MYSTIFFFIYRLLSPAKSMNLQNNNFEFKYNTLNIRSSLAF